MSSQSVSFPKLKGRENFNTWLTSAKSYLIIKGYWSSTQTALGESATKTDKEKDEKALAEITLLLEPHCYTYTDGAKSAKEAWDSINKAFSDTGVCRQVNLLISLATLKLSDCDSMEDYVQKRNVLWQKNKSVGFEIGEQVVAALMLGHLGERYKSLIMSVAKSNLTVDYVQNLLLQEVDPDAFVTSESALAVRHKKFQKREKQIKCYNCGGPHFKNKCPNKRREKADCVLFNAFSVQDNKDDWILDSGATAHMCKHDHGFKNKKEPVRKEVTTASNEKMKITCVGEIEEKDKIGDQVNKIVLSNWQIYSQ